MNKTIIISIFIILIILLYLLLNNNILESFDEKPYNITFNNITEYSITLYADKKPYLVPKYSTISVLLLVGATLSYTIPVNQKINYTYKVPSISEELQQVYLTKGGFKSNNYSIKIKNNTDLNWPDKLAPKKGVRVKVLYIWNIEPEVFDDKGFIEPGEEVIVQIYDGIGDYTRVRFEFREADYYSDAKLNYFQVDDHNLLSGETYNLDFNKKLNLIILKKDAGIPKLDCCEDILFINDGYTFDCDKDIKTTNFKIITRKDDNNWMSIRQRRVSNHIVAKRSDIKDRDLYVAADCSMCKTCSINFYDPPHKLIINENPVSFRINNTKQQKYYVNSKGEISDTELNNNCVDTDYNCSTDNDCKTACKNKSTYCNTSGVCEATKDIGSPCKTNAECKSNKCNKGLNICSNSDGTLPIGFKCGSDSDCQTDGWCNENKCVSISYNRGDTCSPKSARSCSRERNLCCGKPMNVSPIALDYEYACGKPNDEKDGNLAISSANSQGKCVPTDTSAGVVCTPHGNQFKHEQPCYGEGNNGYAVKTCKPGYVKANYQGMPQCWKCPDGYELETTNCLECVHDRVCRPTGAIDWKCYDIGDKECTGVNRTELGKADIQL